MRTVLLSLALLLAMASTIAMATTYPLSVTDDLGRQVTFDAPPRRIVAMAPSLTETVCGLGACDLLVGVDRHSNWPPQVTELAVLGDAFAPDLEAVVALQPDLVLVDEYSGMHEPLVALGLTVLAGTPQTYDETLDSFRLLGRVLDQESAAALLIGRIEGQIAGVRTVLADAAAPTVFVELDPTPYSASSESFIGFLVSQAGGLNVIDASMGEFPQVDPEFVVAADPQVILLTDAPFGVTAADVALRPGWGGLAAVKGGRVIEVAPELVDMLSRPGPRLGQAVIDLARLLHPELF